MRDLNEGLELLTQKYAAASARIDGERVEIGGEFYPLLPWESERRFVELRNLVLSGRIGSPCTYRIAHTARVGSDLFGLLRRELGILRFTLNADVREIFAVVGKSAMNVIAETADGTVATVELAATLREGEEDIDKHEIIAAGGVACDRAVDTQIPQKSIYVYGKHEQSWLDTDSELYGMKEGEINAVRNAFALAKDGKKREENVRVSAHLDKAVRCARRSAETGENITVGEIG